MNVTHLETHTTTDGDGTKDGRRSTKRDGSVVKKKYHDPTKTERSKKALAAGRLVEGTNSLYPSEFFRRYVPQDDLKSLCDSKYEGLSRLCVLTGAAESLRDWLDDGFSLIQQTSKADYAGSEVKWSSAKKKQEMRLPDLRYIVLQRQDDESKMRTAAFTSFMITYEDGFEVIYCYEIHVAPEWQGNGLGQRLMWILEETGRRVGVEKAMLTVFKSNSRAVKFYERQGYSRDPFSPQPRKLRNGTVKESSYLILSKHLKRVEQQESKLTLGSRKRKRGD